ncbi:hypothetical protein ATOBIA_N00990 [Atopobiaceae bacterium P1]|uniref:Uncharacterized protein n=1 Tax=Leptogranulimonas caecicola TaxID=2894156 RepID=A0AAU9CII7_9ACTN|nr:hypothetical protein ATOBIA_N00990 [Atopobiaceae bacterium P1]BDC90228.1 hypothetical protein ATTO_01000 [Leptogranulimonas caecicola]
MTHVCAAPDLPETSAKAFLFYTLCPYVPPRLPANSADGHNFYPPLPAWGLPLVALSRVPGLNYDKLG